VPQSVPTSTYRLQIRASFTLRDAADLVDYLRELGVGALYLSPVLQATTGSDHGYDTTDPRRLDEARGGDAGWAELIAAAQRTGLGVVVDIVPNHVGIAVPHENPAWWDVLRLGRQSVYASWFDVDWDRRILVPILGDDAELAIVDGELRYYEHRFPLAPGTWSVGNSAAEVHDRQHYELVHYSRGNADLNYRRFFAVTTLAGVRVEDEEVFASTHERIARLVREGATGLRVDHPDGLLNPAEYLARLRALAPDAWITVEKILEPGEQLPDWPVAGTTGYDAMREVDGVFVDPDAEPGFTELYRRLTGDQGTAAEHVEEGKRMVVTELLPAEVRRIAALAPDVPDAAAAVAEVAVAFAVYRSYLPDGVSDLDHALGVAELRRPELLEALRELSPRLHDPDDELARRMQQLSGATMAKGVEDTAFYRYARFIALNEVGGDPEEFGIALADFHALQELRERRHTRGMTSLSTHDTKRGEDVRARLAALAEIGAEWSRFAELFSSRTAIPSRPFSYFLAQTLLGAGPIERERMHSYAEKAMREASSGTTWTAPDAVFEAAVHAAVDAAYDDPQLRAGWDELDGRITGPGWVNGLGRKLVQLTMPGIPDVYQGTELWEDSLVDPDNRRPVDFDRRRWMLADLDGPPAVDASGAAKLWVTSRTLRLRRAQPELFTGYRALAATGSAAGHLVAFERTGVVTLATRLPVGLAESGGWRDTRLDLGGPVIDVLSDRRHEGDAAVRDLLDTYPVALLVRL
jgi:(1->4)-alpha-D-glucan 1-alpha-D-glucosylmutase